MRVKDIRIRIHPTFIGLLILCALLGLFVKAVIIFSLVILHEIAHIVVARGYGVKVTSIELYPYGGTAVMEDTYEGKRKDEAAIAFAGPAFNLVLLFCMQILRWEGVVTGEWALEFMRINFWLAAFNLLPILPLDGGRITRAFFAGTFGFVTTTKFLAAAGKWIGGVLVIIGFMLQAFGYYIYEPFMFILLGVFIWFGGRKELANARIVFLKQLCRKKEQLLSKGLMPSSCYSVSRNTPLGRIIDEFSTDKYSIVNVIGNKDKIEKSLSETEVVQGMLERGLKHKVGELTSNPRQ